MWCAWRCAWSLWAFVPYAQPRARGGEVVATPRADGGRDRGRSRRSARGDRAARGLTGRERRPKLIRPHATARSFSGVVSCASHALAHAGRLVLMFWDDVLFNEHFHSPHTKPVRRRSARSAGERSARGRGPRGSAVSYGMSVGLCSCVPYVFKRGLPPKKHRTVTQTDRHRPQCQAAHSRLNMEARLTASRRECAPCQT